MTARTLRRRVERLEGTLPPGPLDTPAARFARVLAQLTDAELRALEAVLAEVAAAGGDQDAAWWSWADANRARETVMGWRTEIEG